MVRKVAGRNKRDPVLHQVHIEGDGTTVASNGHAMMVVQPVEAEPQAMPEMEDECEVPDDGIGVDLEVIDETLSDLPKGNLSLELGFAVLTECEPTTRTVQFTTTDLNRNKTVEGKLARARFPEWKGVLRRAKKAQVMSKQKQNLRVCVDRRELIALLQAMHTACPDPDNPIFIEFVPGKEDDIGGGGIILRARAVHSDQRAIGYIRPVDTAGKWLQMNRWEKQVLARTAKRRKEK